MEKFIYNYKIQPLLSKVPSQDEYYKYSKIIDEMKLAPRAVGIVKN